MSQANFFKLKLIYVRIQIKLVIIKKIVESVKRLNKLTRVIHFKNELY